MRDPGVILVELLDWLAPKKAHPLTIVECGTIRNPSFKGHEDGLSTYHLAKWIRLTDEHVSEMHQFISFEMSHGALVASRDFLSKEGLSLYVTYGLGDADPLLEHFNAPIDLCYLDAGADPLQNLAQYRRATKWLRSPGAIVIDDVFDPRNADRGLLTVPLARMEGRKVACLEGRLALISYGVDDYPLPEGSYWLPDLEVPAHRRETSYCAQCNASEHSPLHSGELEGHPFVAGMSHPFVPKEPA